ncbi:hypothetical protein SO802_018374 [Lithocarpus litseifolius]|uniref:CCHC-type domain-containing protein n=1 Tax=Lithocarpus litseifolius TaxID=425828 RepID=A0AAW2CM77_9ROSI
MDEIATKCAGLRLTEKEESEVDLIPPVTKTERVLVGKFCTKRRVSLESVARVLKSVWRTEKNFEVCDMGENKVLFQFEDEKDLDRVLLLSPWTFDKYLVILHKLDVGEAVNKVQFHKVLFWVQIHGLPTMSQTKEAGVRIGSILGKVEKVDVDDQGFCLGGYLRIRMTMDITQPLCRGRMVRIGGAPPRWVDFKYERLPIFCYCCGKADHDERDCIQWMQSKETFKAEDKQFGAWLRASPDRLQRPQLVVASKQSSAERGVPTGEENVGEGEAQISHGTELIVADQGQGHVKDAVDPGRPETASTATLCPYPTPDFEENNERISDGSKLNEMEKEQERSRDHWVGPTPTMDKIFMEVDTGLSTQNNIFKGQAVSQAQALFTIGPHNPSPSCEAKMRRLKSPVQKKNKKGSNVTEKENAWKEVRGINKTNDTSTKKVTNSQDNEGGLKRKVRLPLEEIRMEEEVGKKTKNRGGGSGT